MDSDLISEEQLSQLLEHDDEAENEDNKKLDLIKCLHEYLYNVLLVSKDTWTQVQQSDYPYNFHTPKNDEELGSTVDHVLMGCSTDD